VSIKLTRERPFSLVGCLSIPKHQKEFPPVSEETLGKHREIATAIIIDTAGRFLLQQRDDVPGIVYPGKVALFGGHREGNETFLECAARELHEELSYLIALERFEQIFSYEGPDWAQRGGTLHAEFFVVRGVPADRITVTEGTLLIIDQAVAFADLQGKLAPSSAHALNAYAEQQGMAVSKFAVPKPLHSA
jgi:8-oxo-dGTP pyrophosphatase MutT (NUDIX family)